MKSSNSAPCLSNQARRILEMFAMVLGLVLSVAPTRSYAEFAERPNVLLIAVDDLNDWVGCPHVPFYPPQRIYDAMGEVHLPKVITQDWQDIPEAARALTLSNPKIPTHEWMLGENRWYLAVKAYLASVRWVDEQIGRVLDALEAGPHADNTIVILYSDHGYHLGEKERWSKFSLWECTTRVPFIVSVPGGTVGTSSKPVELLSIYPTLIELCGLTPRDNLDAVSVAPLVQNPNADWLHVAISTLGENNHAIRDERWRYIRYADGSEELYDHANDPNEWNNLVFSETTDVHAELIQGLKEHIPTVNVKQRGQK